MGLGYCLSLVRGETRPLGTCRKTDGSGRRPEPRGASKGTERRERKGRDESPSGRTLVGLGFTVKNIDGKRDP